jgi:hypothetical protein
MAVLMTKRGGSHGRGGALIGSVTDDQPILLSFLLTAWYGKLSARFDPQEGCNASVSGIIELCGNELRMNFDPSSEKSRHFLLSNRVFCLRRYPVAQLPPRREGYGFAAPPYNGVAVLVALPKDALEALQTVGWG